MAIAILWNTREEDLLVIALLGLWVAVFYLLERGASARPIAITSGTAIIFITLVYATNDRVFRSFARSEMSAPAFQALYHSLLRIKPTEPKPYAPITMDTLHRAFAISPTFANCAGRLMARSVKPGGSRRCGEPAHLTRSGSAGLSGRRARPPARERIFASPKIARRFFTRAAREINAACDNGRLPTRFVLDGFLDPFVQSGGLHRLPASAGRVAARVFAQWPVKPLAEDSLLTKDETHLYDEMTLRRSPGSEPRDGAAPSVERFIGRYHRVAIILLHTLTAAAVIYLLLSKKRVKEYRGLICAIVLLAGAVFLRAALLAWLDATAFDATQDRFLFPILPLWSVVLVLVITLGAEAAGRTYGVEDEP